MPSSSSYINTPNKYQSKLYVCPVLFNISGGRYAKEPQNDFVTSPLYIPCLAKPKSVIQACPSLSNTTLEGFKSLNTILLLCKASRARTISQIYILAIGSGNLPLRNSKLSKSPLFIKEDNLIF